MNANRQRHKPWIGSIRVLMIVAGCTIAPATRAPAEEEAKTGAVSAQLESESDFIPENGREVSPQRHFERHPGGSPRRRLQEMDMVTVERILNMPPEHLHRMRRTIENIERMSPVEKEKLQQRLRRFLHMPEHERSQILQRWNGVPHTNRMRLRQHWSHLTPKEREQERIKIQGLDPKERRDYLRGLFQPSRLPTTPTEKPDVSGADPAPGDSKSTAPADSAASP